MSKTDRSLLAVTACMFLAGCGWFGGDAPTGKARPGADRLVPATGTLPSASPGQRTFEQGVSPADEAGGSTPAIGSVVAGKGGQKAQKEAADKAAAERDAKERDARDAAEREAKTKQQSIPTSTPPNERPPPAAPTAPEPEPAPPKS